MSSQIQQFGTQIELDFRDLADSPPISPIADRGAGDAQPGGCGSAVASTAGAKPPRTVSDLLALLENRGASPSNPIAMLRTAAGHACQYLGLSPERCPVDELGKLGKPFRRYLEDRFPKRNTVKSYLGYVRILRERAEELGGKPIGPGPVDPKVEEAWRPIIDALTRGGPRYLAIARYALEQGKKPEDLADSDLAAWAQCKSTEGRAEQYIRSTQRGFYRTIANQGLAAQLPRLTPPAPRCIYGVPYLQLPEKFRSQVEEVLNWKTADYAPGQARRSKQRAITAESLKNFFCRLYGFATTEGERQVLGIEDLFDQQIIRQYCAWYVNKRKNKYASLKIFLAMLPNIFRDHPKYGGQDVEWLEKEIANLQEDSKSKKREARQRKSLDYEVLRGIAEAMARDISRVADADPYTLAQMVRDQLLMDWLVTFVWRQQNIREFRLGPLDNGGNLSRERVPSYTNMDIPEFASEALNADPTATFWHFYFREEETKTDYEIRTIVPRRLVPLLEDYLQHHRPRLVSGADPGTVFLNDHGRPFTREEVKNLVGRLTKKYAGKRATPHTFRHSFAFHWLKHHPGDYLTVSQALWHMHVSTTIETYGADHDASHAIGRIEQWQAELSSATGQKSNGRGPEKTAPAAEAILEISSTPPGAEIELDGSFVGNTTSSVGVSPGEHTLKVTRPGYKPWERKLKTSTGSVKIAAELELA